MSLRLFFLFHLMLSLSGKARADATLVMDPRADRQPIEVMEVFPLQTGADDEILRRLPTMSGDTIRMGEKLGPAYGSAWLRFILQNPSEQDLERVIYLPHSYAAKTLDFHLYREGSFLDYRNDPAHRASPGDDMQNSSINLVLPRKTSTTVYIRIETGFEQLNQNFQLSTRRQFMRWEVMSTFFVGLFLGILFLTFLANLMQAIAYADRTFLWYSAYLASLILSSLSFYGIWMRMFALWDLQRYLSLIGGVLTLVTGVHFLRQLLHTAQLSPKLDKLFQAVAWIALASFILRFFPATANIGFLIHSTNSILFVLLAIAAGVNAMLHGKELAWLYTSSFLFIALSVTYVRLSHMNIVPISPSALYAPAVGYIMQVILISYVMFIRSRKAHVEALRSQRNHSMNERLNLLLKIISHDIANPLQAISLYCNMALHKVKAEKLPEMELQKAQEAINTQTRIIRHAKEAVRQMQLGQKMQIQPVPVSQIVNEVLQIFQPLCQDRGIRLEVLNELKEDLVIHTDATILVHNIIGNILSNSIKFTPRDGLIQMGIRCLNRRLIFDLVDSGPGISKEKRVEIFTLNVGKGFNEQLTGAGSFGLSILQMCSELLNGQLDIGPSSVSETGQELGLKITVSLPLHHAL